jgi:hypothetical protein
VFFVAAARSPLVDMSPLLDAAFGAALTAINERPGA